MVPLRYRSTRFLRYRSTCLRSWRWGSLGVCMKRQICWTTQDMSGHVMVRYWRAPTKLLYSVALLTLLPLDEESFGLVSMGVVQGLQFSICARPRRSWTHCSCERKRPEALGVMWMPRKWDRGPRSVMANSLRSLLITECRRVVELEVRIMSST